MFQDSVPAGSYNDPFLSSVCFCLTSFTFIPYIGDIYINSWLKVRFLTIMNQISYQFSYIDYINYALFLVSLMALPNPTWQASRQVQQPAQPAHSAAVTAVTPASPRACLTKKWENGCFGLFGKRRLGKLKKKTWENWKGNNLDCG